MKKHISLLAALLFIALLNIRAQQFDTDKLIYGGDIGFGISKDYWTVGVSPQIGYKLSDNFHVGAGLGCRYGKSDDDNVYIMGIDGYTGGTVSYRYTENSASLNLFAHYYPWKKLIFSVKPEIMHTWYRARLGNEKYSENKFVPAITVGGGFHFRPVILQLNYELIQDRYSPYSDNVFLSIGFLL